MLQQLLKVLFLCVFVSHMAVAGTKDTIQSNNKVRYNVNPTYIHNNTNNDLAYVVHGSTPWNAIYGVIQNGYDIYHAGEGDDRAYIKVGICKNFEFPDKCKEYEEPQSCVKAFYDINNVSDVYIDANMQCTVKCRDGSATSCKK